MSPASFFLGSVSHRRHGRIKHRLRYRIAYVLVDLDRMESANALSSLLGVGRRGLMSVRARDHGPGDRDDLGQWVRDVAREQEIDRPVARIELLTMPRMFGYVFNPLSVYFLYDESDELHHVLYEVGNTFGERHFYLCPAFGTGEELEHECEKAFYVSPFFEVGGNYRFRLTPPRDDVSLHIRYTDKNGKPALTASLDAERAPVTTWNCLRILARFPLMTLGVITAIHWEALKLLLKGARYQGRKSYQRWATITTGDGAPAINLPNTRSAD